MRINHLLACSIAWLCACAPDPAAPGAPQGRSDDAAILHRGSDTAEWWRALPRPEWSEHERIAVADDWFEVYHIIDGVIAIYEPGQFEEVISFLILGGERAMLFDTGLGIGNIRHVVDELTALDIVVLNSHTHYDHIGGNHRFEGVYAMDTDFTRAQAGGLPHSQVSEFVSEGWIWKPLPRGFVKSEYRIRPFDIHKFVADGEIIDLGGRQLEILATPGHTPDSICLLDRKNRLLFTGDTFYLAPLYAHFDESDFEAYAVSAARLSALASDIDFVIPSHNVPIVDGDYLMALGRAFEAIGAGAADYVLSDGDREYAFDGFSIITRDE